MEVHIEDFYNAAKLWLIAEGPRIVFAAIVSFLGLWFIKGLRAGIRKRLSQNEVHSSLQPFFLSLSITALYIALILMVMMILDIDAADGQELSGAFRKIFTQLGIETVSYNEMPVKTSEFKF